MTIDDLVPIEMFKYKEYNDAWAGHITDYVHMHIHKETGEYYGRVVTDAGGWISGTRPAFWSGKHTMYDLSTHRDNTSTRPDRYNQYVKFRREKLSKGSVYIECDYLEESPLMFYIESRHSQ